MIGSLAPYAETKDSGVPWLGSIPEHWEVAASRWMYRAVTRRDLRGDEPKMSMSKHRGLVRSELMGILSISVL